MGESVPQVPAWGRDLAMICLFDIMCMAQMISDVFSKLEVDEAYR
jgi:hypothetical protein